MPDSPAPTLQELRIDQLTIDPALLTRCSIEVTLIEELAAALLFGAPLPPIVVFTDGQQHYLADGYHRLRAYQVLKRLTIPCLVHCGSRHQALCYAVQANRTHGKPLTLADHKYNYARLKREGLMQPGDIAAVCALFQCSYAWAERITRGDRSAATRRRRSAAAEE